MRRLWEGIKAFFRPFYRAWMVFAEVLGWVMNRVILTVLFVFIFTPTSLVLWLTRSDLLRTRIDAKAATYWIDRDDEPTPERFHRLY